MQMGIQESIYEYMVSHGISIKFVADKTGIPYELLRRSFHCLRNMTANELINILKALGVKLEDVQQKKEQ